MNRTEGTEKLKKGAECMGVPLAGEQLERLLSYYEMLAEANRYMNLTAIDDLDGVITRHFLDSFGPLSIKKLSEILKTPKKTLIDVGTGAGFPGLPLAIALPELQVTLLDSLGKRTGFLDGVIEKLGLSNARTVTGRAEDFAKPGEYRERFDLAVSRAVADLAVLCEYDLPFVKTGGHFLAYKAKGASEEVTRAGNALQILGGTAEVFSYSVPETDLSHTIVAIEKTGPSPEKYPRRAGIPAKRPL